MSISNTPPTSSGQVRPPTSSKHGLALLAGIGVLLGAWDSTSAIPVALTAPEAVWEFSLSVWLIVRGFRPSPILTGTPVASGKR